MATDYMDLPKNDPTALAYILKNHCATSENKMSWLIARWKLAHAYMNGERIFHIFNPNTGDLGVMRLTKDNKLPVQIQELLSAINDVQGILESIDVRPHVLQTSTTLDSLRKRAMAQLFAKALIDEEQLEEIKAEFVRTSQMFGSAGIHATIEDNAAVGLSADMTVIHPRELHPFPHIEYDGSKMRGIIWQRMVPIERLYDIYGKAAINKKLRHMDVWEKRVGETLEDTAATSNVSPGVRGIGGSKSDLGGKSREHFLAVRVRELWLMGDRNRCLRYVAASKDAILNDQSYDDIQAWCPITWRPFFKTGSPYGAGMFDLLFSAVREFEKLLGTMISNASDLDRYPVAFIPAGQIAERKMMTENGVKLKYVTVDPEPRYGQAAQSFRPMTVAPHNSGDIPGKTSAFLKQYIDSLKPMRDLLKEKGRVDSASGLEFLDEESKRPLSVPVRSISRAFSDIYRYVVSQGAARMVSTRSAVPLSEVSLDLLGASIDIETGTVSFAKNPLPDVSRLKFTIKDFTPRRATIRKNEALQHFQQQIITRDDLLLISFKEGIDFAIYADAEHAAYRNGVLDILTLFNDGVTPGLIFPSPHTARPDIQLRLVEQVLASPELRVASIEVIDKLSDYADTLRMFIREILPSPIPDPFETALTRVAGMGRLPSGQGSPQGMTANG